MTDKTLSCAECGREFVFTVAEQTFFQERGFSHEPKRCLECRKRRRQRDDGRSRRRREGRPRAESDASAKPVAVRRTRAEDSAAPPRREPRPDVPMHTAHCSDCGAETQVPFVPDGVRPVYCLPCLKNTTR